jgi:hypothetical protein
MRGEGANFEEVDLIELLPALTNPRFNRCASGETGHLALLEQTRQYFQTFVTYVPEMSDPTIQVYSLPGNSNPTLRRKLC